MVRHGTAIDPGAVAVAYDDPADRGRAEATAAGLGLPLAKGFRDPRPLHLVWSRDAQARPRLELRVVEAGHPLAGGRGVWIDWSALDTTSPAGRSVGGPLHKAVGIKRGHRYRPSVLDATAGLGEDTWLLAAAGCRVTAVERQPVLHALLADALERLQCSAEQPTASDTDPRPEAQTAGRITLHAAADATAVLASMPSQSVEVVLLDPMFPEPARGRKSLERKPMRVVRMLAGDDADADALWPEAARVASRRVVVKRPRAAPPLADRRPTATHTGKGFRFDVYAGCDLMI